MIDFNNIPFLQAKQYTPANRTYIRLIVLHSMEAPEKGATAEAVANYFHNLNRKASAHYCVDNNSIVQCVQCKDVAYGAPGANKDGIHIEMAGYARQSLAEWKDEYSLNMIDNVAQLCAKVLCPKYHIPAVYLDAVSLKSKPTAKGFTTHRMITQAYKMGTHTDPGPFFPVDMFLEKVKKYTNL